MLECHVWWKIRENGDLMFMMSESESPMGQQDFSYMFKTTILRRTA